MPRLPSPARREVLPVIRARFLDRAAILRTAHADTRRRMAPFSSWRNGDRYDTKLTAWVPKRTYGAIFADMLRAAWRDARFAAEEAAYEASLPPIPTDVAERARKLEAEAWGSPITGRGNERYSALMAQASLMREAARAATFT